MRSRDRHAVRLCAAPSRGARAGRPRRRVRGAAPRRRRARRRSAQPARRTARAAHAAISFDRRRAPRVELAISERFVARGVPTPPMLGYASYRGVRGLRARRRRRRARSRTASTSQPRCSRAIAPMRERALAAARRRWSPALSDVRRAPPRSQREERAAAPHAADGARGARARRRPRRRSATTATPCSRQISRGFFARRESGSDASRRARHATTELDALARRAVRASSAAVASTLS